MVLYHCSVDYIFYNTLTYKLLVYLNLVTKHDLSEGSKIKIDGKINENFEINVFEKIYLPKKLNQKHTLSQNVIYD